MNVLIICSDEHARSALGCQGHPIVKTPTLDAMANRGTRFAQAYTPSPICISARASLATGEHVFEHRCWSSAQAYHGQRESWMHRLRAAGYRVESIGKLHFRSGADDNGFDAEHLPMYLANEGRGWPKSLLRDPLPDYPEAAQFAAEVGRGESDYSDYDRRITEAAGAWLRGAAARSGPWALFVSFVSPHYPLIAPGEFFDLYEGLEMPQPVAAPDRWEHPVLRSMAAFWNYDDHFDPERRRIGRQAYYGLCSFLDHNVRQVLAALDDTGQVRETLVLYLSDHGEMLGSHGFWAKSVMFEDSAAIPLIAQGPGFLENTVNATPVSLVDVAATVEEAAGLSPRSQTTRSLQSLAKRADPDRPVLSEYHDGGSPTGIFMLRQGDWKYVYYAGGYPPQLFDLAHDPRELNDLGERPSHGSRRDELLAQLQAFCDPEETNRQAFEDQAREIEALGGREALLAMASFDHTPVDA